MIERHGLADDAGIAAEATMPEAVAEDRDLVAARDLAVGTEEPAKTRADAQQREETCRDRLPAQVLGLAVRADRQRLALVGGEVVKDLLLRSPVDEVRRVDVPAAKSLAGRIRLGDEDQPLGVIERQAAQDDGIDD